MNRLTRRCLAVFVSAICVKYSTYADRTTAYAAENNTIQTIDENISESSDLSSTDVTDNTASEDTNLQSSVSQNDDVSSSVDIKDENSDNNDLEHTEYAVEISDDTIQTTDSVLQTPVLDDSSNLQNSDSDDMSESALENQDDTLNTGADIESSLLSMDLSSSTDISEDASAYDSSEIEIPDDLSDEDKAVFKINAGIANVSDYTLIGIKTVNDINIDIINEKIKELRDENGADFTTTQVKTKVNTVIKASLKNIRNGSGEIIDYITAGVDTVNDKNLGDVNYYLKGKACTTGDKVKTYVDKILDALSNINKGNGDKSKYQLIGIYNLDSSAIPAINEGVVKAKEIKGEDLTRTEIIEVKDQILLQINQAFEDINNGTAEIESYILIGVESGIVNKDNLSEINEYLQGKKCYTLDSVRTNIDKLLGYIKKINDGCETVNDYREIGISDVTEDSLDKIRSLIAAKKAEKGSDLNKAEIEEVVTTALNSAENSFDTINSGYASVEDYWALGITEVTEDNLEDVNNFIAGYGVASISEVKEVVCPVIRSLNNINAGNDIEDDYVLLGIDNFDNSNIDAVREVIRSREKYLNIKAITEAVDEANNIVNFFDILNTKGASVSDYSNIGALRVDEYNLADINAVLKNQNYKTLKRVQEAIDAVALPLQRINEGTESFEDYTSLSIYGVTESNLETVQSEIQKARSLKGGNLSISEIKTAIASADRILLAFENINNGIAELEDFDVIKVTDVNEENLPYINDEAMGQNLKTSEQVQELVNNVIRTLKAFANINSGEAELEDYEWIGADGVTGDNIKYVNRAVRGQGFETVDEVQDVINEVLEERAAFARINEGTAELTHYKRIGVNGVTEANRDFVNGKVKGQGFIETDPLQAAVNDAVKLYNAFDAINKGTENLADFDTIGVTGATEANLPYVIRYTQNKGYFTTEEVQAAVNEAIVQNDTFNKINSGNAEIADYEKVNVTGVTEENREFVNGKVKGQGFTETDPLQAAVTEAVKLYEAFMRINAGQAEVLDFELIGVKDVTNAILSFANEAFADDDDVYLDVEDVQSMIDDVIEVKKAIDEIIVGTAIRVDYVIAGLDIPQDNDSLDFINKHIKGRTDCTTVEATQEAIDEIVELYEAFQAINDGSAGIEEFYAVGVSGVTEDNLPYVIRVTKGMGYLTSEEVQAAVNKVCTERDALTRINNGQGSLEDYAEIGASKVTNANLDYVNNKMAGSNFIEIDDATAKINSIVRVYDAYYRINKGRATVEDYTVIGVKGVDSYSLLYVNVNLRNKKYNTTEQVQARVDMVLETYQETIKACKIVDKINEGTATVEDYDYIGIDGVTSDNVESVNAALKGQGYEDLDDIQNAVDSTINV